MSHQATQQSASKAPKLEGIVVSSKMDKTIVVEVETLKSHPKYLKRYRSTKRYKVHDPENKCKEGDKIVFQTGRPVSKDKQYHIVEG